ncbi:hypothetical protein WISP_131767 [Willisornis vidua]|uniref:HORMA domain-containing protein n=1 Tax=Willisornis vidua TaxID=1566151 RepID=A0ABQ9CSI2_9PASS|nr:hypothetical protein WISP_131767 [Willisornis vidua]
MISEVFSNPIDSVIKSEAQNPAEKEAGTGEDVLVPCEGVSRKAAAELGEDRGMAARADMSSGTQVLGWVTGNEQGHGSEGPGVPVPLSSEAAATATNTGWAPGSTTCKHGGTGQHHTAKSSLILIVPSGPREKSQKAIQDEIRSVIRQITATVTFLPLLETACAFDLLIYTDKDLAVPEKWEESGPQFIANSEEVRLRSFTTTIHKVNTMVAYKKDSVP